jgi:hypothetical protein
MNEGDAEQGTALAGGQPRIRSGGVGERLLRRHRNDGVQRRVKPLDSRQEVARELDAR